ncbi:MULTISPECIES: hypothetical protein [unclassified Microbulbifer]|uniref:hypothetical protein n=1 Tax=unclassified Microbulbifer TaxID=2619833 RepID=UPI0027E530AA|nr:MULTISPECIES: hypothetical protein [unclassified Microbulbifer]
MKKYLLSFTCIVVGCAGYNPGFDLRPKTGMEKPISDFDSDRKGCIAAVNSIFGNSIGGPTGAGRPILDDPKGKSPSELQNLAIRRKAESNEQELVFKHQEMKNTMYLNCMDSRGWAKSA